MTISLLAAFLGGIISLLSPCSAMILPSFLATSFHQTKKLILATFIFSLGILSVMLPLGLGFLTIIRFFSSYRRSITLVIGLLLILEGFLQLSGRSLIIPMSSKLQPKNRHLSSVFYLGLASGVGSMSCVGPILGAIITLAANSASISKAVLLILAYTAGLIGPLFILSLVWQKNQSRARLILGGRVIHLLGHQIHLINLAAALLFIFLGFVFIKYQGSLGLIPIFTHSGILNFTFDLQAKLFKL